MGSPIDRLNACLSERYTIERELGAGGMATVYLAYDERHDRQVAGKVLRPEAADPTGRKGFMTVLDLPAAHAPQGLGSR